MISDSAEGILLESMLEGMAEYYSAELSEKVIRGQTENALKGKCTGGTGTIGYKIDDDKFYHLDPLTAPLVLEAFQRYDNGDKMVEIVNFLNDKGVRNMLGGKMTHSSVNTMLKNRRYIGELSFRDIVVPDAIPVIVPKDLFDRVQKRLDKNKRAPACGKADEEYLLTTKLFCGKCGAMMVGVSGTSKTGARHHYYYCTEQRKKKCVKKPVRRVWIERLVLEYVTALVQDTELLDFIAENTYQYYLAQNTETSYTESLRKALEEVEKPTANLIRAIEAGIFNEATKQRMEELDKQKTKLKDALRAAKLREDLGLRKEHILYFLHRFADMDYTDEACQKQLIKIFVNAVFVYDDKIVLTFNYSGDDRTVTLREIDAGLQHGVRLPRALCHQSLIRESEGKSVTMVADFSFLSPPQYAYAARQGSVEKWEADYKHIPFRSRLFSAAFARARKTACWEFPKPSSFILNGYTVE